MQLCNPPLQGDCAWHKASDEAWARYAAAVYAAAVDRGRLDPALPPGDDLRRSLA